MFIKIDIDNVFVYFNELYFSVEINGLMNEIIAANDIFSVWWDSRSDFEVQYLHFKIYISVK